MLTKTMKPIINEKQEPVGTIVKYRLFGICFYKKELLTPLYFGIRSWDFYQCEI